MVSEIKLSIHKIGNNRFRFGVNIEDSAKVFQFKNRPVVLIIKNEVFFSQTTCGQIEFIENTSLKFKKGFDLYSKEISEFILNNE